MRKILLSVSAILCSALLMAQTPEDALRYSWLPSYGTARVQALGGASGAIGGEISTIFSNPANIGFYKTGDAVITGGLNLTNKKGTYRGNTIAAQHTTSGFLGTSGVVIGNQNYRGGSMKSSAIGFAVNKTADFNSTIRYNGLNKRSSMADMFIQDIVANNGNRNQFGSDLAWRTYWVDTNSSKQYISPAWNLLGNTDDANVPGLIQDQIVKNTGGITEFSIAGGANFNDNFYFGGAIGIPVLRFTSERKYTEFDQSTNPNNGFDAAYFDDLLITKGVGLNAKLGFVFKPTEVIRIGFAAHSPTFYSLTDNYSAEAGTSLENYNTEDGMPDHNASSRDNVYNNNGYLQTNYSLQTPYKLTGSFTVMLGDVHDVSRQRGFITADVDYVNYMASSFKLQNDDGSYDRNYFRGLNTAVDNYFKGAVNARVGAELKFNTIMARFGGAYYGNPYKGVADAKGDMKQLTGGMGYRNRGFFIDLGYIHTFASDVHYPYRTESPVPFYGANIKSSDSRIVLTLGFKI